MITLLIVVALLCLLFGGWSYGYRRDDYGYLGWSPLGLILLVALILWATGRL